MAKAAVTERSIKNKDTGIDISVPDYHVVQGMLNLTSEMVYDVIVITNLPYFKTVNHKPGDNVQFMVQKRYADFEALYKSLNQNFPATVFPDLPKKVLMMKDSSQQERRIKFHEFMSFAATLTKISTSKDLLEFLGVKPAKIKQIQENLQKTPESQKEPQDIAAETDGEPTSNNKEKIESTASDLFGEGKDEEDGGEDLFGDEDGVGKEDDNLFGNADGTSTKQRKEQGDFLFGTDANDESAPVYLPPGAETSTEDKTVEIEDNSDLLNIEDDLDALFLKSDAAKTNKPATKPKPSLKDKPVTGSKTTSSDLFSADDLKDDDILKYIQDNAGDEEASLDLF